MLHRLPIRPATRIATLPRPGTRRGFTMIELLMVILIISILIAMILPAINSVRGSALVAGVRQDIAQFDQAIAQFKNLYGVEPPSRIILYETGSDWQTKTDFETVRSKAILRRIWPQFDFTRNRPWLDGNPALSTTALALNSGECLTFFIGGVIAYNDKNGNLVPEKGEDIVATGFSKNPADPFELGGNREGPFIDFVANRFVNTVEGATGDGFPEYLDSYPGQTVPLAYLSAYDGKGYDSLDLPPGMVSAYRYPMGTSSVPKFHKPQSYQIISAGPDGVTPLNPSAPYGLGGAFSPDDAANSFLQIPGTGLPPTDTPGAATVRQSEFDNITNFHPGKLKP